MPHETTHQTFSLQNEHVPVETNIMPALSLVHLKEETTKNDETESTYSIYKNPSLDDTFF